MLKYLLVISFLAQLCFSNVKPTHNNKIPENLQRVIIKETKIPSVSNTVYSKTNLNAPIPLHIQKPTNKNIQIPSHLQKVIDKNVKLPSFLQKKNEVQIPSHLQKVIGKNTPISSHPQNVIENKRHVDDSMFLKYTENDSAEKNLNADVYDTVTPGDVEELRPDSYMPKLYSVVEQPGSVLNSIDVKIHEKVTNIDFNQYVTKIEPTIGQNCKIIDGGYWQQHIKLGFFINKWIFFGGLARYRCLPSSLDEEFIVFKPNIEWHLKYNEMALSLLYSWKNSKGEPFVANKEKVWIEQVSNCLHRSMKKKDEILIHRMGERLTFYLNSKTICEVKVPLYEFSRVIPIFYRSGYVKKFKVDGNVLKLVKYYNRK